MREYLRILFKTSFCASILFFVSAHGHETHVPGDFATIQDAINAANPGDTIKVAAGDYTELLNLKSALVLLGSHGSLSTLADTMDDSIIDAKSNGHAMTIAADHNVIVAGFTIKTEEARTPEAISVVPGRISSSRII